MEERVSCVLSVPYLITQHLRDCWQDIDLAREPVDPLAVLKPSGDVDDQRYSKALLVDGVPVQQAVVFPEAFPVVAEADEDGVLVEPLLLVLIDEVLHEDVLETHAV